MTDVIVNCIRELRYMGNELHKDYADTRFMDGSKAITDTIDRKKPLTFQKKPKQDYESLKQNTALVSKLFLSIQFRRDADMGEFIQYGNQKEPPSLANKAGHSRIGTKSDLLKCLPLRSGYWTWCVPHYYTS